MRFITCFLLLMAVAVQRDGSVFGHDLLETEAVHDEESAITVKGASVTVNTTSIASDIKGYGGPVPLEITISDDQITSVTPLKNAETAPFFTRVEKEIIPQWEGVAVNDVAGKEVDAVTGATFSSRAVNATVKDGVAYYLSNVESVKQPAQANGSFSLSLKWLAVLAVILCASILPIFIHDRRYRYIQLALNVVILGFWSGTFLSYEVIVNYVANGFNILQSLPILLMLTIAFIFPYFGRKSHYCTWVCPLGSLQELAGRATRFKLPMSPRLVKALTGFQECLWFLLMFVMCAGLWAEWMGWELFTAFIFKQASTGILIAAILFILLSVVVNRPYCRFVCPTGCLFQITQNPDK